MVVIEWERYRVAKGQSGTLTLLVGGFLIGQGVYLLVRRMLDALGPARIRLAEQVASWDPGLLLASRFGIHRYLASCVKWAAEDPGSRTQSLALFKIDGIGAHNQRYGTLATTELLRRIASELRTAALPESASRLSYLVAKCLPHRQATELGRIPRPRCAGRWSGATFALAFRELAAHQVVTVAQEFAAWMRSELAAHAQQSPLELTVGIALGSPRGSERALGSAAAHALAAANAGTATVVHDPGDPRAGILCQIGNVQHIELMSEEGEAAPAAEISEETTFRDRLMTWLKLWGAPVGCFVATGVLFGVAGGGPAVVPTVFPWPDSVTELPVITESGAKNVRLVRSRLSTEVTGQWRLAGRKLIQFDPADNLGSDVEVELEITNLSNVSRYVGAMDFALFDAKGHEIQPHPRQVVRFTGGLAGKWLAPGEPWSGWLQGARQDAPIVAILFQPDSATSLTVRPVP